MKTARGTPGERGPCLKVRLPALQARGLLAEQREGLLLGGGGGEEEEYK